MLTIDQIVTLISPVREMVGDEAWRAALARLGDGEAVEVDVWPPDPATINLRDGSWVTRQKACGIANCSLDTIKRRIADEDLAIKVGGKWWVNRARLLGCGGM